MTEKKLAALRRNAQSAGRKPKFVVGAAVLVNAKGPVACRARLGRIAAAGPERAVYHVTFSDSAQPAEARLRSWWIEPA
jgi:hypothetical protein